MRPSTRAKSISDSYFSNSLGLSARISEAAHTFLLALALVATVLVLVVVTASAAAYFLGRASFLLRPLSALYRSMTREAHATSVLFLAIPSEILGGCWSNHVLKSSDFLTSAKSECSASNS